MVVYYFNKFIILFFFYFTACNWKHRGQVHSSCHRSSGGLLTGNRVIHLVTETTTARNNRKHYIVSLNKTMNLNFPKPPYYWTSERYKEKIVYKETLIFLVCLHNATWILRCVNVWKRYYSTCVFHSRKAGQCQLIFLYGLKFVFFWEENLEQ